jgi:hypothetical protein
LLASLQRELAHTKEALASAEQAAAAVNRPGSPNARLLAELESARATANVARSEAAALRKKVGAYSIEGRRPLNVID